MGLDYLNKKVWHPGSMKNIQKVWDAQQAQLQVIKRQKERAKKLQDEQYNEDMKRIQVEAGLIPRSHLDRMDWMYDWGNKVQQQKNNQDYLTGAKKVSKENKHVFQEEATNKRCEDFVLLHEDPLYAIQKEELRARQSIMNNPTQMKNIIQEVEEDYLKNKKSGKHKKEKKDRKEKKEKKKKEKQKKGERVSSPESQGREKHHKRRQFQKSRSDSSSSNSSKSSSRSRRKQKNSKLYEDYLKSKFGNILKKNEEGELVPDYSMHKKKYKTQFQLDEEHRQEKLDQLRLNAKKLKQQRQQLQFFQSTNKEYQGERTAKSAK